MSFIAVSSRSMVAADDAELGSFKALRLSRLLMSAPKKTVFCQWTKLSAIFTSYNKLIVLLLLISNNDYISSLIIIPINYVI